MMTGSAQAFSRPTILASIAGNTRQPCQLYPPLAILFLALILTWLSYWPERGSVDRCSALSPGWACHGTDHASWERQSDLVTDKLTWVYLAARPAITISFLINNSSYTPSSPFVRLSNTFVNQHTHSYHYLIPNPSPTQPKPQT